MLTCCWLLHIILWLFGIVYLCLLYLRCSQFLGIYLLSISLYISWLSFLFLFKFHDLPHCEFLPFLVLFFCHLGQVLPCLSMVCSFFFSQVLRLVLLLLCMCFFISFHISSTEFVSLFLF